MLSPGHLGRRGGGAESTSSVVPSESTFAGGRVHDEDNAAFRAVVRPRRSILWTALVSFAVTTLPVFGALYWFTAGLDEWPHLLLTQVLLTMACALVLWRQTTVFSASTGTHLVGRGIFSPLVSVPLAEIRHVVLADVYGHDGTDSSTQFLALDAHGRCRFRLRGQFYHDHDLERLADSLGVHVERDPDLHSARELFARYPGSAFWFEDRWSVRVAGVALTVLCALATVAWITSVTTPHVLAR